MPTTRIGQPGSVCAALSVMLLWSAPGFAQAPAEQSADIVGVLRGPNKAPAQAILVGRSGQLYYPKDDTWARRHAGGIAADVVGAVQSGSIIYAISSRAPFFRLEDGIWQSTKMANRGTATMATTGPVSLAALGKNIYQLKNGSWTRLATAARSVTALWAASDKRIYFATYRGRLRRLSGKTLTIIKNKLPSEDHVVQLAGRSGGDLYGISQAGVLLSIGATEASEVTFAGELSGLRIHCLGNAQNGAVVAAGTLPAVSAAPPTAPDAGVAPASGPAARRSVLVELAGTKGRIVDPLWPLAPGDRFSTIYAAGDLLVATRRGVVGVQAAKSKAWTKKTVSGRAPAQISAGSAGKGPARTR